MASARDSMIGWLSVLLYCLAAVGLTLYITLHFERVQDNQDRILRAINTKTADRWTGTDHERWLLELQRLNPNLKVPGVE